MRLERLIEALGNEWMSEADFDAELERILRPAEYDTLSVPTAVHSLNSFHALEYDGGRVRKKPGFKIPTPANFAEIENRRLRAAQADERAHFEALDRQREAERNPVWLAQRQTIRGVIDERLRELGLLETNETSAVSAGKE
jgi:hypothetical protein